MKMPTDVLIYGSIDEYTSARFIDGINEAIALDANAEIVARINSDGGSPEYGWGMIGKFSELTGKKSVSNDGRSYSMGLYLNCYVPYSSAFDTTQFILHRAAYPTWFESNPDCFTESRKTNLDSINKKLRAAFEAKIDVEKFHNLKSVKDKGITLDKVFSMDSRIDVPLTAKEAKQIGLINEIKTITPSIKAQIDSNVHNYKVEVAAKVDVAAVVEQENIEKSKNKIMTIEQVKADHPKVYAEIVAIGVAQEKDRVEACMVFLEADPKGVKAAIESGKNLSAKQMAEFSLKATTAATMTQIEGENAENKDKKNPTPAATEKEKALASFSDAVDTNLGLKK